MSPGLLIALEGLDGAGTTSQASRLVETLRQREYSAHLTAEPSLGPVGRLIRRALAQDVAVTPEVLAMLFAADRLDHLAREIEPQLQAGHIVVSDRYLHSSLAYQSLRTPLDRVRQLNREARRPDLNLFLQVSAETAARRRNARGGAAEIFDNIDQQRAIAEAYVETAELDEIAPTLTIDAEADFDTVARSVYRHVSAACSTYKTERS